ncbi:hypothetical protein acdb102_18250 [Acidothermaceae bacterium B102]|nr:hypothetical protein acdb102_18250 [Acidothermaceae bacterium B102]
MTTTEHAPDEPWRQRAIEWVTTYQSWIYPALIGLLYLVGRVSADRVYHAYGLSTQDVGFGVEDGVTALVFLLVLVGLAVFLGQLLFASLVGFAGALHTKPGPDEGKSTRDWGSAGSFAFVLALGVAGWVFGARHLEQQTALSCSVAVLISFTFCISARVAATDRPTGDAPLVRHIATGLALVISLIAVPLETSWHDLPQEKSGRSSGGWPIFLALAPHPRAFTLHSREGVAGLADGTCVYAFGSHDGFTTVWGPVGSPSGKGRLVGAGIDELVAGCG